LDKYWLDSEYEYMEIKCQLDATDVFIADLIAAASCKPYT